MCYLGLCSKLKEINKLKEFWNFCFSVQLKESRATRVLLKNHNYIHKSKSEFCSCKILEILESHLIFRYVNLLIYKIP